MKYVSGAFVNSDMSMYPFNDERILNVIFQRQFENPSCIEIEFIGLKVLKLIPSYDNCTCEIHNAIMTLEDDSIVWCDADDYSGSELIYNSTMIIATSARWRMIDDCMGYEDVYVTKCK